MTQLNFGQSTARHDGPLPREHFEVRLASGREIVCRRWQFPDDAPTIEAGLANSETLLSKWLGWHDHNGRRPPEVPWANVAKAITDEYVASLWWERRASFNWLVFEKVSQEFLGIINVGPHSRGDHQLGYWRTESDAARGVMGPVAKALTEIAFEDMHVDRIVLDIRPDNEASNRIARSLGAEPIGDDLDDADGANAERQWVVTRSPSANRNDLGR